MFVFELAISQPPGIKIIIFVKNSSIWASAKAFLRNFTVFLDVPIKTIDLVL